ncbi:MAG: ThiF family adenylyltransferase [Bacteroidia bacterium]|nr:ThiF family adenylyltransferase [Bacteroidia bacterium]
MNYELSISGLHYKQLKTHLFPGDGKEAVAVAICGGHSGNGYSKLLVHQLLLIPYKDCEIRKPDLVQWSTALLNPILETASKKNMSVVKFHSHPTGYPEFSRTDDISDTNLFSSIFGWIDDIDVHGSIVMLPEGEMFGRIIHPNLKFTEMTKISVAGDDIKIWHNELSKTSLSEFSLRTKQTFGEGTTALLRKMKVGVVGCSGTGSPTIEQLVRLGVGKIVLIDPDIVEEKNLNRILNTKMKDARQKQLKVDVLQRAISEIGLGTEIESYSKNIFESLDAINSLISCDVIFGCVDSVDGRHLLNQISTFYLIPYFDIGVKVIADGSGGVNQICGNIHYIQPGGSSLKSRNLYTGEELRSAGLQRTNIKAYNEEKEAGYIVNAQVNSPAVISLNMFASSIAVNEFLARIHPYRNDDNESSAIVRFSLSDSYMQREVDGNPDSYLQKFIGRGNIKPLLNMPELS